MGTDYVSLFDKQLADSIVAMDHDEFSAFYARAIDRIRHGRFGEFLVDDVANAGGLAAYLARNSFVGFRCQVAFCLAEDAEELRLDYWGCYAEVFASPPEGAVSALQYNPEENEEQFILLEVAHVDRMLMSLDSHAHELTVMDAAAVGRLRWMRDRCRANPNLRVAYYFDF